MQVEGHDLWKIESGVSVLRTFKNDPKFQTTGLDLSPTEYMKITN